MLELEKISKDYTVRKIEEKDAEEVYQLFEGNPLYFEYCPPAPSIEMVYADMIALPPRKTMKDKYYCGYFKDNKLVAVLDLIEKYPDSETAFIGFFMVLKKLQGKGFGTLLVDELMAYLKEIGYKHVRLGYVLGNEQATNFWTKNSFVPTGHIANCPEYKIVMAQREL